MATTLLALLLVPSAAPKGIPDGEVVYATWMVGRRFTREEWLDRATGATHRIDTGGPACARRTVATRRAVLFELCVSDAETTFHRVRGPADPRLLDSSDLLRPVRLLRLGRARVEDERIVDGLTALRVRIPIRRGSYYADLEKTSRLPLQFEYASGDVAKLRYRSKRRSSLPRAFFTPRR